MKLVDTIQEVKVLPRATPSQQPSSRTRRPEETKVGSRGKQVDGVCIEPRKLFVVVVPQGINVDENACSLRSEPRTVSCCWNAESDVPTRQGMAEATGVVDQITSTQG